MQNSDPRKVSRLASGIGRFRDVSTGFSMGNDLPIENSVETSPNRPIPGVPVSMLTGHRELSQLDPLHTARAGGRREILHACSRFIELRLDSYWIHA